MLSFDDAELALDKIADQIPPIILNDLNGGIILSPHVKLHPKNKHGDLYIMGEYYYDPRGMGRYVVIYFGSLIQAHGSLPNDMLIAHLGRTLRHELTHHLESLAGDRTLEKQDEIDIAQYLNR